MPSIFKLKNLISTSPNLREILDYFLKLSEEGNVIPTSVPLDEQESKQNNTVNMLIKVVEETAGNFLKKVIPINQAMLCFVEKEYFYHGVLISSNLPIPMPVFYFSDLNKGFFTMPGQNNHIGMFRISLMISNKPPVMNQSQYAH